MLGFLVDQVGKADIMRTYYTKYFVGIMAVVGCMSCASLGIVDSDLQSILAHKPKRYVRTSLNRSANIPVKAPPVKSVNNTQKETVLSPRLKETPEVKKYLELYTGAYRRDVEVPLEKRSEHMPIIETVLNYYDLPSELSNLAFVESKFDSKATSSQGAKGIWQLMRATAEDMGLNCKFWNDERKDVLRSSIAAARYIKELKDKFDDWLLVVAAYNAGPARIEAAQMRAGKNKDFFSLARKGLLPKETVAHVSKFVALTFITNKPENYGFEIASQTLGDQPIIE